MNINNFSVDFAAHDLCKRDNQLLLTFYTFPPLNLPNPLPLIMHFIIQQFVTIYCKKALLK